MVYGTVTVVTVPARGLGPLWGQEEDRTGHRDFPTYPGGRSHSSGTCSIHHLRSGTEKLEGNLCFGFIPSSWSCMKSILSPLTSHFPWEAFLGVSEAAQVASGLAIPDHLPTSPWLPTPLPWAWVSFSLEQSVGG